MVVLKTNHPMVWCRLRLLYNVNEFCHGQELSLTVFSSSHFWFQLNNDKTILCCTKCNRGKGGAVMGLEILFRYKI